MSQKGKPFLKKATAASKTPVGSKHKHGLGRGIDGLFSSPPRPPELPPVRQAQQATAAKAEPAPAAAPSAVPAPSNASGLVELNILDIERSPYQPRRDFKEEELQGLAESLKNNGLVQPPTVRKNADGRYELIAGERRLRAAQLAGWKKILVNLIEADDLTAAAMTTTENLQRENLNPIEEAVSYKTLQDKFNLTQAEVAEKVGKGRATVANSVRLLELPDEVKALLQSNLISVGHAKVLLSVEDEKTRVLFARDCVNDQLTVRALEKKVARLTAPVKEKSQGVPDLTDGYVRNLQDALKRYLGCAVRLTSGVTHANGRHVKGVLEIDFFDNDELDRVIRMIGVKVE